MLIDQTHKRWAWGTLAAFLVAAAAYTVNAALSLRPPDGGSWLGLIFGILGYGMIVFATLLGLRKRFPVWRVGRMQKWMRGHLWLGALSYPLILFHSGLNFGSGLTRILMWILTIVVFSGILGALLQHYMPRLMTQQVSMETIYGQIDRVRGQLLVEADALIASLPQTTLQTAVAGDTGKSIESANAAQMAIEKLQMVYAEQIRPFLSGAGSHPDLENHVSLPIYFEGLSKMGSDEIRLVVEDLENICKEKSDIDRQRKLHRILHGWLLIHVPLSYALVILGLIHAIAALRYS